MVQKVIRGTERALGENGISGYRARMVHRQLQGGRGCGTAAAGTVGIGGGMERVRQQSQRGGSQAVGPGSLAIGVDVVLTRHGDGSVEGGETEERKRRIVGGGVGWWWWWWEGI